MVASALEKTYEISLVMYCVATEYNRETGTRSSFPQAPSCFSTPTSPTAPRPMARRAPAEHFISPTTAPARETVEQPTTKTRELFSLLNANEKLALIMEPNPDPSIWGIPSAERLALDLLGDPV